MTRAADYDTFISYSHAADGELAPQLQRGLEQLAKPWSKRRALRVFRDDTGLSASPDLWDSIVAGLDGAKWFVVLASPDSAASVWVNREIEHWLASSPDPRERLLPVVTGGIWRWDEASNGFSNDSTAVPPAIREAFHSEPRHLDLSWARDDEHLDLRRAEFRSAIADLAAPMHGIPKDDLESDDIRIHRRTVRLRRAAVASLAAFAVAVAALAVVALVLQNRAARSEREAIASEQAAIASEQAAIASEQEAIERAAVATSQALASQSGDQLDTGHVLGGLLAVESRRVPDLDTIPAAADAALLRAASRLPALVREIPDVDDAAMIAIGPAGDRVAVARRGGTIEIHRFDGSAPTEIADTGRVAEIGFDPTGDELRWYDGVSSSRYQLASGDRDETPLVADGQLLAVSDDGSTIVTVPEGQFGEVSVTSTSGANGRIGSGGFVSSAALNSDGSLVAVESDGQISIVRWPQNEVVATLNLRDVFEPQQRLVEEEELREIVFADDDITLHLLGQNALLGDDFRAPEPWFGTWTPGAQPIFNLQLEGLGMLIASTGDGRQLADIDGNVVNAELYPNDYDASATLSPDAFANGTFSADGSQLATVDFFGRARVWEVAKRLGSGAVERHEFPTTVSLSGATSALAPDGSVVAGGVDGSVFVADPGGGVVSTQIDGGLTDPPVAGFASDGSIVATSVSRTVVMTPDLSPISPDLPPGGVGSALAPDRGVIVIPAVDPTTGEVVIERRSITDGTATGDEIRTAYSGNPDPFEIGNLVLGPNAFLPFALFDIVVDPTETRFAIELGDRVEVYELDTGELVTTFADATAPLAFDASGTRLAIALPGRPGIVDAAGGGEPIPLDVDGARLFAFSPDGSTLAVVVDQRVRVIDTATGLATVDGLGAGFAPIRLDVAVGSVVGGITYDDASEIGIAHSTSNGSTFVETATWTLAPDDLENVVCTQAGRNLSAEEWDRFFTDEPARVSCPAFPAGG